MRNRQRCWLPSRRGLTFHGDRVAGIEFPGSGESQTGVSFTVGSRRVSPVDFLASRHSPSACSRQLLVAQIPQLTLSEFH